MSIIVPHIVEGSFDVDDTSGVWYTTFPTADSSGTALSPPLSALAANNLGIRGYITGVTVRIPTSGGITLGASRFTLYKDLRYWADGTTVGAAALTYSIALAERRAYASSSLTPTPDDAEPIWDSRLRVDSAPEPFERGLHICFEHSGGSGSGITPVYYSIQLELLAD